MTTSRDLAYQAIGHKQPERLPMTLYLDPHVEKKLTAVWGHRCLWPVPEDDIIRILWPLEDHDVSDSGFRDRFGCEWKREEGSCMFVNPPLLEPDASKIPRISLITEKDIAMIRSVRACNPEKFIFYQFTSTFGERLWCLRGLEQTLMDYILEPDFVHHALDDLLETHLSALEKILPLPIDGVTFGCDYGMQKNLMISRDIFLKFFKPRLAILYEKVRNAGKIAGHHSCGDNTEIMGDFVDIGLQMFHPLQPEAMDIRIMKREFGKDLTFRGGIGTQGKIIFGTPAEAAAEVRNSVKILAEDGGYFLETSKPLPREIPLENAIAVIHEFFKVAHYEF
jgi:uroporphyrinogen decarboxylase